MEDDASGSGWRERHETAEDPDLVLLESHVCEALHQLNLKRRSLTETLGQLDATDLARHELERLLERSRQQSDETRLQLDLAAAAARRWEDVGVGGREVASRQRTQLELTSGERDGFRDQARQLQAEVAKLRSKTESDEGQLRVQASYYESQTRSLAKVRSLQDNANRQLQKLEADHRRLEAMVEEALRRGAELDILTKHSNSSAQRAANQKAALEEKVARLSVELQRTKVSSPTRSKLLAAAEDDEVTRLRELVREMESRLISERETTEALTSAHDQSIKQQAQFQMLLTASQEKLDVETGRASELEAKHSGLVAEFTRLGENLRLTQQILETEREKSKKAECVERGVQCSLGDPPPPPPLPPPVPPVGTDDPAGKDRCDTLPLQATPSCAPIL